MAGIEEAIAKLQSVRECEAMARNALERSRPDLAALARRRAIRLRAERHGATTDIELECIEAVLAYEDARSQANGRRTPASRTWPMLERHGIIGGVERIVERPTDALGYNVLVKMGLEEYAFEAVILRHPDAFSDEAVRRSRKRLEALRDDT